MTTTRYTTLWFIGDIGVSVSGKALCDLTFGCHAFGGSNLTLVQKFALPRCRLKTGTKCIEKLLQNTESRRGVWFQALDSWHSIQYTPAVQLLASCALQWQARPWVPYRMIPGHWSWQKQGFSMTSKQEGAWSPLAVGYHSNPHHEFSLSQRFARIPCKNGFSLCGFHGKAFWTSEGMQCFSDSENASFGLGMPRLNYIHLEAHFQLAPTGSHTSAKLRTTLDNKVCVCKNCFLIWDWFCWILRKPAPQWDACWHLWGSLQASCCLQTTPKRRNLIL